MNLRKLKFQVIIIIYRTYFREEATEVAQQNFKTIKNIIKPEFENHLKQIDKKIVEYIEIKRCVEEFKSEAEEIGKVAAKEGHISPTDLFWRYHPAPKRLRTDVSIVRTEEAPKAPHLTLPDRPSNHKKGASETEGSSKTFHLALEKIL